jgi:16S rRNA (adenine1518-N6/adenine1519-N6)-dimethyltransferase
MNQAATPAATAALMKQYKIVPSKALGQNFLVDSNILEKITNLAQLSPQDGVLEIGPGLGALTSQLILEAGKVVAVEIDDRLFGALESIFAGEEKVSLLHQDALTADFAAIFQSELTPEQRSRLKVVANIPYSITGPLVARILQDVAPALSVLMVQGEVARRMAASPGGKEYGSFSVLCQFFCQVTIAFKVPGSVFIPRPEVDSAVVVMLPRVEPLPVQDSKDFFRIVRTIFTVRRKTLVNGMLLLAELDGNRDLATRIITGLGWSEKIRGETLRVEEFVALYDQIKLAGASRNSTDAG